LKRFKLQSVNIDQVKNLLETCKNKPPGVDDLDSRLLKLAADFIAPALITPGLALTHIINLSFSCCTCPQAWKQAKIVP